MMKCKKCKRNQLFSTHTSIKSWYFRLLNIDLKCDELYEVKSRGLAIIVNIVEE